MLFKNIQFILVKTKKNTAQFDVFYQKPKMADDRCPASCSTKMIQPEKETDISDTDYTDSVISNCDGKMTQQNRLLVETLDESCLIQLAQAMVNQENAQRLIEPMDHKEGFWFGAGNVVESQHVAGELWLCGRYRNSGDSRTKTEEQERGIACAIFRCKPESSSFELVHFWPKKDLAKATGQKILSIEGTCLHWNESNQQWEFYISTEKRIQYPDQVSQYQKSGTGVWSIDRVFSPTLENLSLFGKSKQSLIRTVLSSTHPSYLHVKDPVVYSYIHQGRRMNGMLFSCAPFSWSSSGTGFAMEDQSRGGGFTILTHEYVTRGSCWDVAITRITSRCSVPLGMGNDSSASLYFYDGAECVTPHQQNVNGVVRPRGFSCHELGGLFIGTSGSSLKRVSEFFPLFSSPFGSRSSRYVDACWTSLGLFTCWQQAQDDGSQPLVYTLLSPSQVSQILAK